VAGILAGEKRRQALQELRGWVEAEERDAIRKTFHFSDFSEAFGFMARVALIAERADHHPEWLNIYNRVEIVLTTHDAGGVTGRDIAFAQAVDAIAPPRDR